MRNLLSFELRLQARQLSFGLFMLGYFAFSILLGTRIFGGENEVVNSDYSIAFHLGLLSLSLVFPIMFFSVKAGLRDQQYGVSEIIFSTSISRWRFFASRYLGVTLAATAVVLLAVVGFALGIYLSDVAPSRKLAFSLMPYLRSFIYILLPNTIILATLIFSISCWTKSSTATYLGATLIYITYWVCSIFLNSPLLANAIPASSESLAVAAILDPFGLSAFFEQTQFWTIAQKNQYPLSPNGLLCWNRLTWLGASAFLFALVYSTFSWKKTNARQPKVATPPPSARRFDADIYWAETATTSSLYHWCSFVSLFQQQLHYLFRSLPFLISLLALTAIFGIEMYSYIREGGEYQQNTFPTSAILIERIVDPLLIFTLLLLLFYTSEMMWRAENFHFTSIIDTSPVGLLSRYFAQFVSLAAIPFTLISLAILCGLGFQLLLNYDQIDLGHWLGMYYYQGSQLLLYLVFILGVHLLVSNQYIGLLLSSLLLLLLSSTLSNSLGIYHPLLRLARLPSVLPSDMNGYGFATFAFHHYAIYWTAFLATFTFVAIRFWKYPRAQLAIIPIIFCSTLFLLAGVKIFYHTNIEMAYRSPKKVLDQMEDYERRYKQYETLAHLSYQSLSSKVDLYPSERTAAIESNYTLINLQQTPIGQLLLSARKPLDSLRIEGADLMEYHSEHQTYLYRFRKPIVPGQKVHFYYKTTVKEEAFSEKKYLATNGSFLLNTSYEPVLFYRPSLEINDPQERAYRGLPIKTAENPEEQFHHHSPGLPRVDFDVTLSVPFDQYSLAPGRLLRQWVAEDRSYYQYQSQQPIVPMIAFIAGKYKLKKQEYRAIQIEQYYHSTHHHNIDSIQRYVIATLDYCIANFGPYPYDHLRIAEIPAHWNFGGQAQAGLIAMVSDRLYLTDIGDTTAFNLIAKRTIHEVAHQWWGHLLAPKNIAGASLIIEGLAKYTEAMVMQQLFGADSRKTIAVTAKRKYLQGRALDQNSEPPLYLQDGQDYLAYGKSCLALLAIEEVIGEKQMNATLRQLIQQFGQQIQPQMTSLDLLDALRCYLPQGQHTLFDQWFMESGLPEF